MGTVFPDGRQVGQGRPREESLGSRETGGCDRGDRHQIRPLPVTPVTCACHPQIQRFSSWSPLSPPVSPGKCLEGSRAWPLSSLRNSLIKQDPSLLVGGRRRAAEILRQINTGPNGRPPLDRLPPPRDVG